MGLFVLQNGFSATYLVVGAALILGGWAVMYIASRRALRHTVEELRHESEDRIRALEEEVRKASARTAPVATSAAPVPAQPAAAVPVQVASSSERQAKEEVSPEILLVIAAAVTAFLGKKVRIRSARMLPNPEIFSAWAQQGRVFVQASHNLSQRGR